MTKLNYFPVAKPNRTQRTESYKPRADAGQGIEIGHKDYEKLDSLSYDQD